MEETKRFTTAEVLQAAREGAALVKQSDINLNKARIEIIAKYVEKPVEFILKHEATRDIKVKTCRDEDIAFLETAIEVYNTTKDTSIKNNENTAFKAIMGFDIKDIIANGKLERELSRSSFDKYIDHQSVAITSTQVEHDHKFVEKKSFRCYANDNVDGSFKNRNHIIHEDAGSAWNCLLTTKLKHFNYGFIYYATRDTETDSTLRKD